MSDEDLPGAGTLTPLKLQLTARVAIGGDANLDDVVNLADFNVLAANFGQAGRTWETADVNRDGVVNLTDFNQLAANFGLSAVGTSGTPGDWSALAAAVPETAGVALALLMTGVLPARRNRRWPAARLTLELHATAQPLARGDLAAGAGKTR